MPRAVLGRVWQLGLREEVNEANDARRNAEAAALAPATTAVRTPARRSLARADTHA